MAVYKPSNCRPFLNAEDLTKDVNVQCEINTSNQNITGYKLRLLNNNNDVVFEGKEYTFLENLRRQNNINTAFLSGINGTLLIVPLIIAEYEINSTGFGPPRKRGEYPRWKYVDSNSIYYIPDEEGALGGKHYFKRRAPGDDFNSTTAEVVENFSNGNANMPYKWEITLAQSQNPIKNDKGELVYPQEPIDPWAYDILVSTGQILGSNYQRIQSNLSDNIYRDYYVQLLDSEENPVNDRVRISSYDRTYGYIYPQEGFITEQDMSTATRFIIYKDTNDPNYVLASRTVNYVVTQSIETADWWQAFGIQPDGIPAEFTVEPPVSRGNKYYYDMRVTGVTADQYRAFNNQALPLDKIFKGTPGGVNASTVIFSSTRFLFIKQASKEGYELTDEEKTKSNIYGSTFSSLNGVWVLIGAVDFKGDETEESQLKSALNSAENKCNEAEKAEKEAEEEKDIAAHNFYAAQQALNQAPDNQANQVALALAHANYAVYEDSEEGQKLIGGALFDYKQAVEKTKEAQQAVVQAQAAYDARTGDCYIRWQRPNDANTWANYVGRNWFVADGFVGRGVDNSPWYDSQLNLSSNAVASTGGEINVSPLAFFPEEEIAIYPKQNGIATDAKGNKVDSDTIGTIFKNDKVNGSRIYIKPFAGLREGMRINWSDKNGKAYYANISNIDTNYWSVKLSGASIEDLSDITTPGTQYKITSFFKVSDENPFYAYTTPKLQVLLKDFNGALIPFSEASAKEEGILSTLKNYPYTLQLNSRFLEVWGKYEQEEHISWKRFRWILFDASVNNIQATENIYDGEITYLFDGLQEGHRYQLTLEVEDEQGIVQTTTTDFQVTLKNLGSGEAFPLEVAFDCDTQSVDINFVRNGIVVPDYYNSKVTDAFAYGANEQNGRFTENDNRKVDDWIAPEGVVYNVDKPSVTIPNEVTIQYENTKALVLGVTEADDVYIDTKLSAPLGNDISFNSRHVDINPYFVGELFEVEVSLDDELNMERVKIGAFLPSDITFSSSNKKPVGFIPNPSRNQILINYWSEKRKRYGTEWEYNGLILPSKPVDLYQITSNAGRAAAPTSEWRKSRPIVYSYQRPGYIEKQCDNAPGGLFDFLPITYYDPTDENQIKDRYGNTVYLKIDGTSIESLPQDGLVYYYLPPAELNSSIAPIGLPLIESSWSNASLEYKVQEEGQSSSNKQNYNVLLQENSDTDPSSEMLRGPYYVRKFENLNTLAAWKDEMTYLATQINEENTLMYAMSYEDAKAGSGNFNKHIWADSDSTNSIINKWEDNCAPVSAYWYGVDVNKEHNHTGREEISRKEISFNIALKNFDPTKVTLANSAALSAIGWIEQKIQRGRIR